MNNALELSKDECLELEKRVAAKLHAAFPSGSDDAKQRLYEVMAQMASRATIMTVREYEKMQAERQSCQSDQQ